MTESPNGCREYRRDGEVVVNVVVLAGRVADRPFRPGNGDRVVVKLDVDGENPSKSDRIEIHCFGAVGERAMRLWQGDLIGVRGRIELRIWVEDGEEYDELRVVAHRIDVMVKGNNTRPPREGGWQNRDGREGGRGEREGGRREGGWNRDRDNRGDRGERSGGWNRPNDRDPASESTPATADANDNGSHDDFDDL